MMPNRQDSFRPRRVVPGGGVWQEEEPARWGEGEIPEQELVYTSSHEVELKFGGKTVSLGDPGAIGSLPTGPGIYFIYANGNIWYVGKGVNIRARFQERMKAFSDFKIPPAQYLPLLRPVTVRWYELARFTDPKGSSFKIRGSGSKGAWRKLSTRLGLLLALEQHFISKYGTKLLGNRTAECVRGGAIAITYDFGASRKPRENVPATIFC